ncbi:MAG: hypothetical protein ACQSGP_30080, partial [Frankia sp.]
PTTTHPTNDPTRIPKTSSWPGGRARSIGIDNAVHLPPLGLLLYTGVVVVYNKTEMRKRGTTLDLQVNERTLHFLAKNL